MPRRSQFPAGPQGDAQYRLALSRWEGQQVNVPVGGAPVQERLSPRPVGRDLFPVPDPNEFSDQIMAPSPQARQAVPATAEGRTDALRQQVGVVGGQASGAGPVPEQLMPQVFGTEEQRQRREARGANIPRGQSVDFEPVGEATLQAGATDAVPRTLPQRLDDIDGQPHFQLGGREFALSGPQETWLDQLHSMVREGSLDNRHVDQVLDSLRPTGASGQPTGPLNTIQQTVSTRASGPVSQTTQDMQAGANDAVTRARQGVLGDEQLRTRIAAEAQGAIADEQGQLAQQQADQEAELQGRINERLEAFAQRIEDVGENRVDTGRAFGGPAGRAVAGLAIVLGNIFRTGDTNQALSTIESMIGRDIQAQQADMAHSRATLGQEGNALAQMRGIVGDERAAASGLRSAQYGALLQRLRAQMAHMRPDQLAFARELETSLMEQQRANAQAALEAGRVSIASSVSSTQRARGPNAAAGAVRAVGAQQRLQDAARSQAEERDDLQARGVDGSATEETRARLSEVDAPAVAAVRNAGGSARRSGSGRRRAITVQGSHMDQATFDSAREAQQESSERDPDPIILAGFSLRSNTATFDARRAFNRAVSAEGGNLRVTGLQNMFTSFTRNSNLILTAQIADGIELTTASQRMEDARAAAMVLRQQYTRSVTGAGVSETELQQFLDMFPAPGELSAGEITASWSPIVTKWRSLQRIILRDLRDNLESIGLEPPTIAAGADAVREGR